MIIWWKEIRKAPQHNCLSNSSNRGQSPRTSWNQPIWSKKKRSRRELSKKMQIILNIKVWAEAKIQRKTTLFPLSSRVLLPRPMGVATRCSKSMMNTIRLMSWSVRTSTSFWWRKPRKRAICLSRKTLNYSALGIESMTWRRSWMKWSSISMTCAKKCLIDAHWLRKSLKIPWNYTKSRRIRSSTQFNRKLKMKLKNSKCFLMMTCTSRTRWPCANITECSISQLLLRHTLVHRLALVFLIMPLINLLQHLKQNIM